MRWDSDHQGLVDQARFGRLTLAARLVQLGFGDHTFDFDLDPLHRSSSRIRRIGLPPSLGVTSTLGRKAPMLVSNVPR